MAIHAVALVRGANLPDGLSGDVLDDAALVKTAIRFDLEPDDLASALLARLGDAFGDEARGVFVIPDVALSAAKSQRTFDAVVEAIGEAGMWIKRPAVIDAMGDHALGMDDILAQALAGRPVSPAMLASLLGGDAGRDDEDAEMDEEDDEDGGFDLAALMASPELRSVIEGLAGTIAASPETQRELEGAAAQGLDFEALAKSPAIAQLMQSFTEELSKNPAALSALLTGGVPSDEDE